MWIKRTPEEIAAIKHERRRGWTRGALLFGTFVFLLTLFINGPSRTASTSRPFFVPGRLITRRLPFSIAAGVVCGLFHLYYTKRTPTVVCPKCDAVKYQDDCFECKCGGHFEAIEEMKWQ
jgi:hypothetical protein